MRKALLTIFALASSCAAQQIGAGVKIGSGVTIGGLGAGSTHTVVMTVTMTSNANSTGISVAPTRKQLGNFGTNCSGGTITPSGVPVGQLYATTAIQTSAEAAGCATQGVPTVTSSGTGITAPDNGQNSGGTDSATALTDTYGDATYDSYCTSDTHANDPSYISSINFPGCATNGSSTFSQTVVSPYTNVSTLFPSLWGSNSTALDLVTGYIDSFYWSIPSGAAPRNLETDVNLNSSSTAYGVSHGAYYGWGVDYSFPNTMYRVCPQGCSAWTLVEFHPVGGGSPLTTYPITLGDVYHTVVYGHRGMGAGYNQLCYDAMTVYDVTAAQAPATYAITDTSGGALCFTPVSHPTWTSGPDTQAQFDQTSSGTSTVHMSSRTTIYYY